MYYIDGLENLKDEEFKKMVNYDLELRGEENEYQVIAPKSHKELIDEGHTLKTAVAYWTPSIMNGKTQILFLRKVEDESLMSLEIKDNNLLQAKGMHNRNATDEELLFLKKYCANKKLSMNINNCL